MTTADRTVRELAPGETSSAAAALHELRPHVRDTAELVRLVDSVQRAQGYRVAAAFVAGTEHAVAAIGFRDVDHLAWGAAVYVDDLTTLPAHRGAGHAGALLDWVERDARARGRTALHLDSGHHRHDAHRVYHAHRLQITSHHFAKSLATPET